MIKVITGGEAEKTEVHSLFRKLASSEGGLSTSEAEQPQSQFGFKQISEKRASPLLKFLRYFWGPIPWMIEVAAILSQLVRQWADSTIILVLLIFNGLVSFWQR
jgi:H+-transporting ATPase